MATTTATVNNRTRGITAAIEGFFAFMWFGWGQADPPSWLVVPLTVGSVASGLAAVAGIVLAIRSTGEATPMADPAIRRRYNIIVGLEFGLLALGSALLGANDLDVWIPVWVCAGVGVHFIPLSRVFPNILLMPLAILIAAVAAAALVVGLATDVAPGTITGVGAGACLLVGAVLLLSQRSSHVTRADPG